MGYRKDYEQSNVGLGMVPCKPNCRCSDCTIDRLRAHITELEDQLQKWRDGFQGACYACEPVGEKNVALRASVAELEAERDRLREAHCRLQQMVDAQALDEGLWFEAETAAEAYLQQELRKLHAVVEAAALEGGGE